MASRLHKDLKLILHPYVFVLKEGKKIQEDFLDYSLLILQVGRPETIKSPKGTASLPPAPFQEGMMGSPFEFN